MSKEIQSSTVDFSNASNAELVTSLSRINKDKFPANFAACVTEIQKRKSEGRWTADVSSASMSEMNETPYSNSKRFFAFLFDSMLVVIIGAAFYPISDFIIKMGIWGYAFYMLLFFGYWVVSDGPIGHGQSPGKRLLGLRVVSIRGGVLSWKETFVRGAWNASYVSPLFGFTGAIANSLLVRVLGIILLVLWIMDLIFIIKHPQKRSILDIFSGAVVQKNNHGAGEYTGFAAAHSFKGWLSVGAIFFALVVYATGSTDKSKDVPGNTIALVESRTQLTFNSYFSSYISKDGQEAKSHVFVFSVHPAQFQNSNFLTEQSRSARKIIYESFPHDVNSDRINIIIVSLKFFGLLPSNVTFNDPDPKF